MHAASVMVVVIATRAIVTIRMTTMVIPCSGGLLPTVGMDVAIQVRMADGFRRGQIGEYPHLECCKQECDK